MTNPKNLRTIIGIIKDMVSITKVTLTPTLDITTTRTRVAVIRATAHGRATSPPSDTLVYEVLSPGQGAHLLGYTCIGPVMDRLQGTGNACVALKCLVLIHNIITKGSFVLKDQLSNHSSLGGRNFLNLSGFVDKSNSEMWELSSWVRWYASIIEQDLIVSRFLGYYLCSSSACTNYADHEAKQGRVFMLLSRDLLGQLDKLVDFVELVCEVPLHSLHLQRKYSLVHEVIRLVGEEYGHVQREISTRVQILGDKLSGLSNKELTRLLNSLERLEACREKLKLLLANRKRNDAFWDFLSDTKTNVVEMIKGNELVKSLMKLEN